MDMIIPTVGSSGYFDLRSPFDTKILSGERYTCQAVRRISDYLANNETPLETIYVDAGLTEVEYEVDLKKDMYIVSLQAGTGHWVYVPASYINTLPIVNGIPYRTLMIGVALPAMPADKDFSNIQTAISNLVTDTLGVTPNIKLVETSKTLLLDSAKHDILQSQRNAIISNSGTDRAKHVSVVMTLAQALDKISVLEAYIEQNSI